MAINSPKLRLKKEIWIHFLSKDVWVNIILFYWKFSSFNHSMNYNFWHLNQKIQTIIYDLKPRPSLDSKLNFFQQVYLSIWQFSNWIIDITMLIDRTPFDLCKIETIRYTFRRAIRKIFRNFVCSFNGFRIPLPQHDRL